MKRFFSEEELQALDKHFKINLINSAAGVKPAVLIGTRSAAGIENLAIFSSLVHLGSNPPLMGFVMRPHAEVPRHTFQNILQTLRYTLNHVPAKMWQQAHRTGDKFPSEVSEFETCGFTPAYQPQFDAPHVAESPLVLGMHFLEAIPISHNQTTLVIGKVVWLAVQDSLLENNGYIDHSLHVGVSGINGYYTQKSLGKVKR